MQRPKEHVRAQFVAAASELFAEAGFATTTMGAVAERAGSSIGNLYKYFPSKEALFDAVVPASFVAEVRRLTRARIEALGTIRDIRLVPADARYHVLAGDLLDLCLAHREAIVILLVRAEGTPFAAFAEDFTKRLVGWALDYVEGAWPTVRAGPEMRFALRRIYRNYLAGLADAFITFRDEAQTREAVAHLTAHHQGGLKNLFESAANSAVQPGEALDDQAPSDNSGARRQPSVDAPAPSSHPRDARARGAGPGARAARTRKADRPNRA